VEKKWFRKMSWWKLLAVTGLVPLLFHLRMETVSVGETLYYVGSTDKVKKPSSLSCCVRTLQNWHPWPSFSQSEGLGVFSQQLIKRLLPSSCLPVRLPRGTDRLPPNGCTWKLTLEVFTKLVRLIHIDLKQDKETLCIKTYLHLCIGT
jgi:hypothetical protein